MQIKVVYIDDDCDPALTRYLDKRLAIDLAQKDLDVEVSLDELKYEPARGYQSLLSSERLRGSDVAIIDSRLFDLQDASEGMLSGEMVKTMLRRCYPFLETMIVSSHEEALSDNPIAIAKYSHSRNPGKTSDEHYADVLLDPMANAIRAIEMTRKAEGVLLAAGIDSVLVDKIRNSIAGLTEFDELTAQDIDDVVRSFERLKGLILRDGE